MTPHKKSKLHNYPSLKGYSRYKTREIRIGDIPLGGSHPLRIQSMTNTNTMDTGATVEQCIRIIREGADYVRITTRNIREAENLENIKTRLRNQGFRTPLIADVHFNPEIALIAAQIVEKVRINPGNFTSMLSEEKKDNETITSALIPLLTICKKHHTAIRIGVNHGSLSRRMLEKYGDTPMGMVASVMEYLEICEKEQFHKIVVSIKSSNTRVLVHANRLLAGIMYKEDMNYPFHLGVTEAGEGEEGRIKSAVGIGTLLNYGIGDTIRISLTEDPEAEIPVARKLIAYFSKRETYSPIHPVCQVNIDNYTFTKRVTDPVLNIGGGNIPVVIADFSPMRSDFQNILEMTGYALSESTGQWVGSDQAADYIYLGNIQPSIPLPSVPAFIVDYQAWKFYDNPPENLFPLYSADEYFMSEKKGVKPGFLKIELPVSAEETISQIKEDYNSGKSKSWPVLVLETKNLQGIAELRAFMSELILYSCKIPVIFLRTYQDEDFESVQLKSSCDLGGLLIDGCGDGIWIKSENTAHSGRIVPTGFSILQACRTRITRPEYISCPSCGRTLFDLQEVTAEIRRVTAHLKGLKIAIMGCIVNGPGEMADADYGYVGSGKGQVTLYKNKKITKRGIPSEHAVRELIHLIKSNGDWVDP
ncbi:MAG: (E)-4-hydroxy-3-methylbut-2-enyl-diphosphate synthase [Bacteroidales bacterium]|nr:MAG: (E)-4-hydroxy-3-methylbut-2-enyl-diphosphate synthase [Bacteroidales bacterium]